MKKSKTLLGLLMISGLLITGCDKKENKVINDDNSTNVNNNDENGNNSDSGNENNNENENSSSNGGNENQGGNEENNENGNGSEYNGGNNNGNENNGSQGGNENGGGNTTNTKSDWDDDEKAVFDEYFYGLDVPYMYFPGEEKIVYYDEQYTAFKYCEESTGALLEAYAELFDNSWVDYSNYQNHSYFFEKHFTTEEGLRIVTVEFYAVDDEDYKANDGNGHLYFMVYEPYDYEWPDYFFEDFYEYYELTSTVPEYLTADYYEIDTSAMDEDGLDAFAIYCYTDSETAEEDYLKLLGDAGYKVVYVDEESGTELYGQDGGDIVLYFGYDSSYGSLDIYIYVNSSDIEFDGDNLTPASFIADETSEEEYKTYHAIGETTGVEYDAVISTANGIQLTKKDGIVSGIVSKTSAGLLLGVSVTWNENTAENQEILIYASNEAFDIADMYDEESTKCEYIGTILNDGNGDAFYIEEEYTYIGLRSKRGTVFLDEIFIAWADGGNSEQVDPYDPNKADWSDDEKATISDNFYGVTVPYINVENETFIRYYAETGSAVKTAPNSSAELLAAYAELFDNTWNNYSDLSGEDGGIFYCFEKDIDTDEGVRHAFVRFYGGIYDENYDDYSPTNDGSGTFVLEIFDPFCYSWPEDLVDEFQELYGLEDEVPAFEGADFYEIYDEYFYYFIGIFCYTGPEGFTRYVDVLTQAGYVCYDTDAEGNGYYAKQGGDTSIAISYDEDVGSLDIYIEEYIAPEVPVELELEGDELTLSSFGLTEGGTTYVDKTATGQSGATYSANLASQHGIQLRSKQNHAGIVTTTSGGIIEAIGVVWNSSTTDDRTLYIYASNEPFTIADMYNGKEGVVKVGEIDNSSSIAVFDNFEEEYAYVGIRMKSGAAWFDKIVFAWSDSSIQ